MDEADRYVLWTPYICDVCGDNAKQLTMAVNRGLVLDDIVIKRCITSAQVPRWLPSQQGLPVWSRGNKWAPRIGDLVNGKGRDMK